jgi:hypothetical protein
MEKLLQDLGVVEKQGLRWQYAFLLMTDIVKVLARADIGEPVQLQPCAIKYACL